MAAYKNCKVDDVQRVSMGDSDGYGYGFNILGGNKGGFKWWSQHDLCRLIGETGQAPLRVSSNQASFGAAS